MKEAFKNLKLIFGIDAIIFFLCLSGIVQISEKAKLPFDISQSKNHIFIKSSNSYQFNFLNNAKLYSVDGLSVSNIESVELVTDLKNIGDTVEIKVGFVNKVERREVKLSNFYSDWYLVEISFVSLLFFITAVFLLLRKPEDKSAHIFHWACIGIASIIDLTWANSNVNILIPYAYSRFPFHILYVLTPVLFLHFTFTFPRDESEKYKLLFRIIYLIAVVIGLYASFNYMFFLQNPNERLLLRYLESFNLIRLFLILCVLLAVSNFVLRYIKAKESSSRKKIKWVLFGFVTGPLCFVFLWALPIVIWNNPFIKEELILLFICSVPITFAVAIIKYHIFDIDYILNRSIVYLIVISFLTLIYIALLSIIVSNVSSERTTIFSVISAVLIAVLFQPLKNKVQLYVDKKFFRVNYDFKKTLNLFLNSIQNFYQLKPLADYLIEEINKLIPLEKIGYCEYDKKSKRLKLIVHNNFEELEDKSLFVKDETLAKEFFRVAADQKSIEPEAEVSLIYQKTLLRWNISLVVPIKSHKGELFGVIIFGRKKSGTKYSLEDIELLKAIGVQTASVVERIKLQEEIISEKLEAEKQIELNRQKSLFVSSVSHDLKTPITSIKLFTEKIMEEEKNVSDKTFRNLKIINGESDRLTRLINNVLDFSKLEKGIKNYSFRKISLNKVMEKVLLTMQYIFSINRFNLSTEIGVFNDCINGDEDALIEALENVITNSIKYSGNKKEILIKTYQKGDYACIMISDKGKGINQEDLDKIFEPYVRSDTVTEGTGLGLAIVKHIVDAHSGKIEIHSQPNKGTDFEISLPLNKN
uniref:histidine kinase n=1 Tax=Ignavibacterium album TaxID=591197 RepID=A0A832DFY4_9BACT